jgi:hypothetical protein
LQGGGRFEKKFIYVFQFAVGCVTAFADFSLFNFAVPLENWVVA